MKQRRPGDQSVKVQHPRARGKQTRGSLLTPDFKDDFHIESLLTTIHYTQMTFMYRNPQYLYMNIVS